MGEAKMYTLGGKTHQKATKRPARASLEQVITIYWLENQGLIR
jgi:hypothetical protein